MPLRCAIIEDEPLAQELLERYIGRVTTLELIATFDDAVDAFARLPALRPDLLFVDINMPEMTGIDFLRAYPVPHPLVIMTTANPNHALDGFDLGVADYLLKPITFERFTKAIDRVQDRASGSESVPADTTEEPINTIYLKTAGRIEQVGYDDIVFIEAIGDYVKVFTNERFIVTHVTMTKLADTLPADRFLRINRSYIVHRRHIRTLRGNTVGMATGQELPIGTNYRELVKGQIRQWVVD